LGFLLVLKLVMLLWFVRTPTPISIRHTAAAAAAAHRVRLPYEPKIVQLLPLQLTKNLASLLALLLLLLLS
jgi:hypothetical protein